MTRAEVPLDEVCRCFGLGNEVELQEEAHGGVNRVWRVRNQNGEYAVHQLLGVSEDVHIRARCAWVAALEFRALQAGVRVPKPVLVPGSKEDVAVFLPAIEGAFIAHEWYEASPVNAAPISDAFASSLGDAVARVHTLNFPIMRGPDVMDRRPTESDWSRLGSQAADLGFTWAGPIRAAAPLLEAALQQLDEWDAHAASRSVASHRDLTSANLLNDADEAVLIDWESAGPTTTSAEIGRTALDNFLAEETLDRTLLAAYLGAYASRAPLPPVELDWCSLWIRGLIVFAEYCANGVLRGTAPTSLLGFQHEVVASTPVELERRLRLAPSLVEQFRDAANV